MKGTLAVMVCACKLCIRSKEFQAALEKIPEQERKFWTNLYDDLNNVEQDRDYYKVVVDGSWPNADEVIAHHRAARNELEVIS